MAWHADWHYHISTDMTRAGLLLSLPTERKFRAATTIINHQTSIIPSSSLLLYLNDNHNKNNLQLRPGMAMLPGSLHRSSLLAVQDHARSQKGRLRLFSLARSPILHASTLARLVSKLVPAMPLKAMRMTMLPPKALTCCQCTVRQGHPMPRGLTVVR